MSDSQSTQNAGKGSGHSGPTKFQVRIDRDHFEVAEVTLTGTELRMLPDPAIGPERDLFEVVPGGSDIKIENAAAVEMRNGLRFFTAPAQINPGR